MPLLTLGELRTWTRESIPDGDEFALAVIDAASLVVSSAARHPEWDVATAPSIARLIAAQLAKRTYLNPNAVAAEGSIGPIGGDRFVEDFARTLELTPVELASLEGLWPAGASKGGGLWTMTTEREPMTPASGTIFVPDDSGSDWHIPFIDESQAWAVTPEVP